MKKDNQKNDGVAQDGDDEEDMASVSSVGTTTNAVRLTPPPVLPEDYIYRGNILAPVS